jgi:hypothetical protein
MVEPDDLALRLAQLPTPHADPSRAQRTQTMARERYLSGAVNAQLARRFGLLEPVLLGLVAVVYLGWTAAALSAIHQAERQVFTAAVGSK